ncbi:MAG: sialate O-acetylesterase, partial [Oscillospiraceae bacterium]|nr:sialate O-acetylesterase [Oscillospiraceae bacterium]
WVSREFLESDPQIKRIYLDEAEVPKHEWCVPCALYDTMLMTVCPYTLAGVIWYQGESDTGERAAHYGRLFSGLIKLWREKWGDSQLPFLFCQLPMHIDKGEPNYTDWAVLREQQDCVSREVPNVYMAVLIDCGEFDNIHPFDKATVGERLALIALNAVYGADCEAFAPRYKSHTFDDSRVVIEVEHCGGGLVSLNADTVTGFEIAGADCVFRESKAEIVGNTVILSCEEVPLPCHARYLWTNYTDKIAVYGQNGLPLSPFYVGRDDPDTPLINEIYR